MNTLALLAVALVASLLGAAAGTLLTLRLTRPRPAKPQPVRPIGPQTPYYQRGTAPAWVHRDPTPTERIQRIRDHAPRLARRAS